MNRAALEIDFTAPPHVRDVLASIGRTEDVRFSPSQRRLAVAAFHRNLIAVFDLEIARATAGTTVAVKDVAQFFSPCLQKPHGLDFIDEDVLVVANRGGGVALLKLPSQQGGGRVCELSPIQLVTAADCARLTGPSSVSAGRIGPHLHEILVCDNCGHCVTRHTVDAGAGYALQGHEMLLQKWLDIPDGVSVSRDRRWLAVSNHGAHHVVVYDRSWSLHPQAEPDGILRGVQYPHGLRFSPDGRHLFVADAGAPFVHLYAQQGQGWQGVRHPVVSCRVMEESLFLRGRQNPQEGGPKGLDIDDGMQVLVVTSACQPLAFFDLPAIMKRATSEGDVRDGGEPREQRALEVRYELDMRARFIEAQAGARHSEARASAAEARTDLVMNTMSWRITAPLRRLYSALRKTG